jgi:hypothetical protein
MAHTERNLWPQLVSWDNLVLAYRRCRRRKSCKPEAVRFDFAWEANLLQLQGELIDGCYQPGPYRHFYIHDPKKRKISAAPFRDRVVHHAVVNVLEPLYEKRFIHDSYACRRNKGTHRALDRAQHFLRRYPFYLKTDIIKFFPNVDHAVLRNILHRRIADRRLLGLIDKILASGIGVLDGEAEAAYFPGDDLFAIGRPRGLPLGNLTSQFFANVVLDQTDHFIKEVLRVPGYVRYCDDLVLFGADKEQLWTWHAALTDQLAGLRLRLHQDKTYIRPSDCSLKFLGFRLHWDGRRLLSNNITRFTRRLRHLHWLKANGFISRAAIGRSVQAWLAHVETANSVGVRRAIGDRLKINLKPR